MVCGELCAKRVVFVDEMGSNTSLHELYAYSPRGQRAYCSVARNRGKNTTLLCSMTFWGMGPSMVVEGGTEGAVFEGYLRELLVPALGEGDVVVMDNLCVPNSETVRKLIEGAGAHILYLPPYSPDFNPIEICQPQCAFEHKLSYPWPPRAARAPGVGRETPSRPHIPSRGGPAMSSRGAVPPRP
jgi:hypothetical protein